MGFDKYYLYKQQRAVSGTSNWEDVIPTVLSIDGNGTMPLVLAEADSPDCGYEPPIEPMYRWINLNPLTDYYCSGSTKYYKQQRQVSYNSGNTWSNVEPPEYRMGEIAESASTDCETVIAYKWVNTSGTTCSGTTLYRQTQKYQSTDGGQTWAEVIPREYGIGEVIQYDSSECGGSGTTLYRWYTLPSTQYICIQTTKYYKQIYQVSYNSGQTWTNVVPEQVRASEIIEENSVDCGYIAPIERWVDGYMCDDCVTYGIMSMTTAGTAVNSECTSSTTISPSDVQSANSISACTIGNCYTAIGNGAFSGSPLLWVVRIPDSITIIGDRAFQGCQYLLDASIPDSVTSIGSYAFSGCTQLTYINLPNNLTSLGEYAFRDCMNFSTINIPMTLTSLPTGCFYNADGLADIMLPSTITSIGDSAFQECSGLQNLQINATTPPTLGSNALTNTNANMKIMVPAESVDVYKAASGWSAYANKIQAITS